MTVFLNVDLSLHMTITWIMDGWMTPSLCLRWASGRVVWTSWGGGLSWRSCSQSCCWPPSWLYWPAWWSWDSASAQVMYPSFTPLPPFSFSSCLLSFPLSVTVSFGSCFLGVGFCCCSSLTFTPLPFHLCVLLSFPMPFCPPQPFLFSCLHLSSLSSSPRYGSFPCLLLSFVSLSPSLCFSILLPFCIFIFSASIITFMTSSRPLIITSLFFDLEFFSHP